MTVAARGISDLPLVEAASVTFPRWARAGLKFPGGGGERDEGGGGASGGLIDHMRFW
jgi:hypothetical protein